MEGLLPLFYKAIKKNKTRRQYECLSSGDAVSYNISMAEMYPQNQNHVYEKQAPQSHKIGHRRHQSVPDFANGFQSPHMRTGADSLSSKQLVGVRSQKMFSCITGA